nr:4Fe-4S dicluster domain-containing protein [Nitrospirota bacterium]
MGQEFDKERREFLKQSVLSVGKTVYEYYEQQKEIPADTAPTEPPVKVRVDWLRPPGAVEEELFLDRCTKCGDCLPACPYESIKKDPATGYPVIFANESPCHLCDDFPCIAACETEALLPVGDRTEVRMGVAVVSRADCTADQGCRFCLAKCPVEALSVDFIEPYPVVDQEKCVGCGICEQVCSGVNDRIAIKVISGRFEATKSP